MGGTTLNARHEQAWHLREDNPGLSKAELAELMGVKVTTIRVYLSTADHHYGRVGRAGAAATHLLEGERTQRDIGAQHGFTPTEMKAINKELDDPANEGKTAQVRDLSDRTFLRKAKTIRDMMADEIIARAGKEGGLANEKIQSMAIVMGISHDKVGPLEGKPSTTIRVEHAVHIDSLIAEVMRLEGPGHELIEINPVTNAVAVHADPVAPSIRHVQDVIEAGE